MRTPTFFEKYDEIWWAWFNQRRQMSEPCIVWDESANRRLIAQRFAEEPSLLKTNPLLRFAEASRRIQHKSKPVDELYAGATEIGTRWSDQTEIDEALALALDPNATKPIPALT